MQHAYVTWILYIMLIHPFSYQKIQGLPTVQHRESVQCPNVIEYIGYL
jgi:hypothetical protein